MPSTMKLTDRDLARHRTEPWCLSLWKTAQHRSSSQQPMSTSQGNRSANEASVKWTENSVASVLEFGQLGHKSQCVRSCRVEWEKSHCFDRYRLHANLSWIRTQNQIQEKLFLLLPNCCTLLFFKINKHCWTFEPLFLLPARSPQNVI